MKRILYVFIARCGDGELDRLWNDSGRWSHCSATLDGWQVDGVIIGVFSLWGRVLFSSDSANTTMKNRTASQVLSGIILRCHRHWKRPFSSLWSSPPGLSSCSEPIEVLLEAWVSKGSAASVGMGNPCPPENNHQTLL